MEVIASDYGNFHVISTPERSPTQSPQSTSPSPEQHHSPRGTSQEQSLHIIVEPQLDGHTNFIHLMNPPSGQILSSFIAEHGSHIEIQQGVFFRVPFPHEHGYPYGSPPMHLQPQAYQTHFPTNIATSHLTDETTVQSDMQTRSYFNNPTCPVHGSTANENVHTNETCDERLEKRRERLQEKLREKNGHINQCTCYKNQTVPLQQSFSYTTKGNMIFNKELSNMPEIEEHQDVAAKTDVTICSPPKVMPQDPYTIIISWDECISNNRHLLSCQFELELSKKGNNFKCIYSGGETSFSAQNLIPGIEYHFRVCAVLNGNRGSYSDIASCATPSTVPDRPLHPRISHRTKNVLTLKWTTPFDGGSQITQYRLQWSKGEDLTQFTDLYVGPQKQYKHSHKLPPVTPCMFRLQAKNQHGVSEFSETLECLTSAGLPGAPEKPMLEEHGIDFVKLTWTAPECNGAPIEEYTLEMEDPNEGYGFMPKYCGEKTSYTCTNLWRNTVYKFRLLARNNQGNSKYSTSIECSTLAETPGKMEKIKVNGKVRTHVIPVKWDPPKDNGGDEIIGYTVEIADCGGGSFTKLYHGLDREYVVEHLRPGNTYQLRVASESRAGMGPWSPVATITTIPISPRDLVPPRLSKRDMTALYLEWDPPLDSGGAPVKNYIIKMSQILQDEFKQIYSGDKHYCSVTDLQCGTEYFFKLQATNTAGSSPWSETVMFQTSPGPPDVPISLTCTFKSPTHIRFDWKEPDTHGTPVTGYCMEKLENEIFQKVYQGNNTCCELKGNMLPASIYFFRLQALSDAGGSPYSNIYTVETPPGPPGHVTDIKVIEQTSNSCLIRWKHPIENGSPIFEYCIEATGATSLICTVKRQNISNTIQEISEVEMMSQHGIDLDDESHNGSDDEAPMDLYAASETSSSASRVEDDIMEHRLTGLTADASYKLRIQAVNHVGTSAFSHVVNFFTKELPPAAPSLNALNASYHSIKLKWADSTSSKKALAILNHNLQVQNKSGSFVCVYNGMGTSFTLSKLKELTPYCCRIRSRNDAGEGEFCKPKIFYTKAQPPAIIKDVRCKDVTESSLTLTWSTLDVIRSDDTIEYVVQKLHQEHDKDFSTIYRGINNRCKVNQLQADQIYQLRVQAVRILSGVAISSALSTNKEIKGVYSSVCRMRTLSEPLIDQECDDDTTETPEDEREDSKRITDTQIALLILGSFLGLCILTAILLKWVVGEY